MGLKAALGEIVGVGWYVVDVCGSLCCGEGAGMSTNKHARTQTLLQHSFTLQEARGTESNRLARIAPNRNRREPAARFLDTNRHQVRQPGKTKRNESANWRFPNRMESKRAGWRAELAKRTGKQAGMRLEEGSLRDCMGRQVKVQRLSCRWKVKGLSRGASQGCTPKVGARAWSPAHSSPKGWSPELGAQRLVRG